MARPLLLFFVLCCAAAHAATVQVQSTALGQNWFRMQYSLAGRSLMTNQELAIQFSSSAVISLANGSTPAGFDLLILQPNNPPGAAGLFSALALIDNPVLSNFRVDVLLLAGQSPGIQSYQINQLDSNGRIISTLDSGSTIVNSVPEPATFSLAAAALLLGAASLLSRSRRGGIGQR